MPDSPFIRPINWQINSHEVWGVVGPNGSGKSLLAELMCGKIPVQSGKIHYHFLDKSAFPSRWIKKIDFNAAYSLLDYRKLFYQQRFNHSEYDSVPLVSELFQLENISEENRLIFRNFHLFDLMDRKFIHLSSGELRKLIIAKTLLDNPKMLIFDNPFIGLDEQSRVLLNDIFAFLLTQRNIQLMFLAPTLGDLPACTTHILKMKNCTIEHAGKKSGFTSENMLPAASFSDINWNDFMQENRVCHSNEIVSMADVDIAYGKQVIQKAVNWNIYKNEKWALLGPNGSGKSTLLSYIFADNPQAYAKNIRLFGRKRGTGESIWDIKKRIGFTSSELNLYYRKNATSLAVIASGFFDSIELFRKSNEQQILIAEKILEILRITHLKDRSFLKISSGEQRLVLFARAIIKNPQLLILDEPFHGLDDYNKKMCTSIVESFAQQNDKSLIYVTHRMEEIPDCIDHYKVLHRDEKADSENEDTL